MYLLTKDHILPTTFMQAVGYLKFSPSNVSMYTKECMYKLPIFVSVSLPII